MQGFIRSPPPLVIYYVAHSLLLGSVGKDFSFSEDETPRQLVENWIAGRWSVIYLIYPVINNKIINDKACTNKSVCCETGR